MEVSSFAAGLACVGMACAGVAGYHAWAAADAVLRRDRYRKSVRDDGSSEGEKGGRRAVEGVSAMDAIALDLAMTASRRVSLGRKTVALPSVLLRCAWYEERAVSAGLADVVCGEGFSRARLRLLVFGAAGGFLAGATLSAELAVSLACLGAIAGWRLVYGAVSRRAESRAGSMERRLPEMLDVIALGMRSGLSFDRSLQLYGEHFDTALAGELMAARSQWVCGLETREAGLRRVAESYDSAVLRRVVEGMTRSLRFGSPMVEGLESAAREARAGYRAQRQEQVAKAPVKMMVPTGALILPAMLILVLGPVLLELTGGY